VFIMKDKIEGKVWKFGDDIDTDIIIPGRYLVLTDENELAKHAMEGVDPEFHRKAQDGDIILAGKNFGCGSSREHAPIALKAVGISAVVAESFARIFYRNAINVGLPLLESEKILSQFNQGDKIELYTDKGILENERTGEEYEIKKLPEFMLEILDKGGLILYLKEKLKEEM